MPSLWTTPGARGVAAAVALAALLAPAAVSAHRGSVTYVDVEVSHDRQTVDYQLRAAPVDLAEAVGLPEDTEPTEAELDSRRDALFAYIESRIDIRGDDVPCPQTLAGVELLQQTDRFVAVSIRARCPLPIEELIVDYELFFELDSLHTSLFKVAAAGETASALVDSTNRRFRWSLGEPPPSGALGFLRSGVDHILYGYDHIVFLIGLLLVVVIAAHRDGAGPAELRARELRAGLRYTAAIVTSFTVAHTITLIAAALGWIALPGRLVESIIAASILYIGVENILRSDPRRRHLLTFGFGLFHGLGFASMLSPLLPPSGRIVPLLMFNLGVELGQLAIALAVFPVLHLVVRKAHAPRYRAYVAIPGSALIALFGLLWLLERALNVSL